MITDDVIYWGLFLENKSLRGLKSRLGDNVPNPVVTFAYKPAYIPDQIFGEKTEIETLAHAYDGHRDAYEVRFLDEKYKDLYYDGDKKNFFVLATRGSFVTQHNARDMFYVPLEDKEKRVIKGRFGYMSKDGCIYFQSPEETMWLKMMKELKSCLNDGSFRVILKKYKADSLKDIAKLNDLASGEQTAMTPENKKIKKFLKSVCR